MLGGETEEIWRFVDSPDGKVDLLIPDVGPNDCHYNDAMAALAEIYGGTGWVIVDQGAWAENGEFVTLAREETE